MERPRARDHHAAGADDTFLERVNDGLINGMAHTEIVCIDEQQAGIGRVSQEAVRSGSIPRVHRHLATPSRKCFHSAIGTDNFRLDARCYFLYPERTDLSWERS